MRKCIIKFCVIFVEFFFFFFLIKEVLVGPSFTFILLLLLRLYLMFFSSKRSFIIMAKLQLKFNTVTFEHFNSYSMQSPIYMYIFFGRV